jgi:hypothetical protein
MPRLTRKFTAALLTFALCVLAATLWLGLRFRGATSNPSQPGVCEEWKRAEVVDQGLGWSLTYEHVLRRSGLCPGDPFCEVVAKKPQPPVAKHVAEWQGDPIISSMLIELPDGHAEMGASWAVRTKDQAYLWVFHPSQHGTVSKQPIPGPDYDRVFEAMACWRQDEPLNSGFGEKGYIGFLSLYRGGKSRQMLLTNNDLFEGNTDPDAGKPGRFFRALEPLRPYW